MKRIRKSPQVGGTTSEGVKQKTCTMHITKNKQHLSTYDGFEFLCNAIKTTDNKYREVANNDLY